MVSEDGITTVQHQQRQHAHGSVSTVRTLGRPHIRGGSRRESGVTAKRQARQPTYEDEQPRLERTQRAGQTGSRTAAWTAPRPRRSPERRGEARRGERRGDEVSRRSQDPHHDEPRTSATRIADSHHHFSPPLPGVVLCAICHAARSRRRVNERQCTAECDPLRLARSSPPSRPPPTRSITHENAEQVQRKVRRGCHAV